MLYCKVRLQCSRNAKVLEAAASWHTPGQALVYRSTQCNDIACSILLQHVTSIILIITVQTQI